MFSQLPDSYQLLPIFDNLNFFSVKIMILVKIYLFFYLTISNYGKIEKIVRGLVTEKTHL